MNIFYFDDNIERCARDHCDAHVVKMILGYAQILYTSLHMNQVSTPYKPTHRTHPCVLWANRSLSNSQLFYSPKSRFSQMDSSRSA